MKAKSVDRLRVIVASTALLGLIAVLFIGFAGCSSPTSEWKSALSQNTQWGKDLKDVLDEAGVTDVASVETTVTLNEKDGDSYKKITGSEAKKDLDDFLYRSVTIKTESGKTLETEYHQTGYISLSDADTHVDYWVSPSLREKPSSVDLVSYQTGEVVKAKDEAEAARIEELAKQSIQKVDTTTDLTKELEPIGYTHEEAWAIQETLERLGVGSSSGVQALSDNTPLKALCADCNGHQVNFTTENGALFYVQITGWTEMEYDWYVNWRGKLKYGIVDKKLSFDLYDTTQAEDGFLAYYKAADDSVVPWEERYSS